MKDPKVLSAMVCIDKVMWVMWTVAQVDNMLPVIKAAIMLLLPANPDLAKEVWTFLLKARYGSKYRGEFTNIDKWTFFLLTGLLLWNDLETNNPCERAIQTVIQCLERRRQFAVHLLFGELAGLTPAGVQSVFKKSVSEQMVDLHTSDEGRRKTEYQSHIRALVRLGVLKFLNGDVVEVERYV